jgi:hypothetical protein
MDLINQSALIVGANMSGDGDIRTLNTLTHVVGRLGMVYRHPAEILIQNGVGGRGVRGVVFEEAVVVVQVRGLNKTFKGKHPSFVRAVQLATDAVLTYLIHNEDRLEKLRTKEEQEAGRKNRRRAGRKGSKGKRSN